MPAGSTAADERREGTAAPDLAARVDELAHLVGRQVLNVADCYDALAGVAIGLAELRNAVADLALRVERLEAARPPALAPH